MATKPKPSVRTSPGRPGDEIKSMLPASLTAPQGKREDLEPYYRGAQKEPEAPAAASTSAEPPEPVQHRQGVPAAPSAKTGEDQMAIRHIRRALEDAGYSKHPQAAEAALEQLLAVPVLRAGREVHAYKAEAADFLRGKVQRAKAGQ